MINDFFKKLIDEVPLETQIFVDKYEEISMRIYELLESKNMSQKDLADLLGKRPSEVSKWLNEGHNITLKTIAKIEAALGEDIINIPLNQSFSFADDTSDIRGKSTFIVYRNHRRRKNMKMSELTPEISKKLLA
jgi:transcriptional regulator with XRE-family HTH domain